MPSEFAIAKQHAQEMATNNGKRNLVMDAMEDLFWMRWPEEDLVKNQMKNVKVTRSPRARNAILGAKRLLTATDPIITVPCDINNVEARDKADSLEKFCKAMFFASGRIAGNPIHYDAILSALLYSDVAIGICSTQEMIRQAASQNPAIQERLEDISKRTPYIFEVYNPKSCYGERSILGLSAFYREVNTTAGEIEDLWGEAGLRALRSHEDKKPAERKKTVTLCDYYDLKNRFLWLNGCEKPILEEEHGMPFIPVAYSIVEGSSLFSRPEEQREPFLYTAYRSGIIDRENLILTTIYTMLFSLGANPMFVDFLVDPDNPHDVDWSVPGGTVHYRLGEKREVMTRQVVDPAMMDAWNIANDLEQQSTIYRQAMGEPVSANTPYSSLALLSQSGRLPLVATQKMVSHALGEALEIALKWLKKDNKKGTAKYEAISAELTPDQIPDIVDIKVQLEIELPQDRLQMANAANMLAQGENPMVSKSWVRENVLNIGQSGDMDKAIWDEKTTDIYFQKFLYQKILEMQQLKQAAMMPPNQMGSGMPGANIRQGVMPGGAMPQNLEGGMPAQPPNYGTPPQPNTPPGAQPAEPVEPFPPLAPNLQPVNKPRGR
jgi:hypothetical protein